MGQCRNPTAFVGKVQTGVLPPVISGSSAARRSTIRVARATFRPARFASGAVRRTVRLAFRIAFRPARRILLASRRPVRRDCRVARRLARRLFLRGMFSSLTMMCQCASLPTQLPPRTGTGWGGNTHDKLGRIIRRMRRCNCYFPRISNTYRAPSATIIHPRISRAHTIPGIHSQTTEMPMKKTKSPLQSKQKPHTLYDG
jgi:hypothetical protein